MLVLRIALILILLRQLPFAWPLKFFLFLCIVYGLPIIFNVYNAAFLLMGIALVDNTIYWQNRDIALQHNRIIKNEGFSLKT